MIQPRLRIAQTFLNESGSGPQGWTAAQVALSSDRPKLPTPDEECDEDDDEEDRLELAALGVVPDQHLLGDSDEDARHESYGYARHPCDDRRRESPHQQARAEELARGKADGGQDEHDRERGDGACDRPRQCRHTSSRHARQPGGIAVVSRGPDRQAISGLSKEQRQGDHNDRGQYEHRRVGRSNCERSHVERGHQRRLGKRRPCVDLTVQERREREQERSDAQSRHERHERRSVAEAPHHDDFAQRAGACGQDQRQPEGDPVGHVSAGDEQTQEGCAESADLTLGEIDDLAGPVDQHQAGGEYAVGHAGDGAEQDDVIGHAEAGDRHGRPHAYVSAALYAPGPAPL